MRRTKPYIFFSGGQWHYFPVHYIWMCRDPSRYYELNNAAWQHVQQLNRHLECVA